MFDKEPEEIPVKASIQPLKKVILSLMAGSDPGKFNLTASPVFFEFIHGVSSDGLCPFEAALHDKREGDNLIVSVRAADAHEFFGHIYHALRQKLGLQIMPETIFLEIEITAVSDADDREVVQSVAKALAHGGCGGSCGCGC
jgi:hypothetical protein